MGRRVGDIKHYLGGRDGGEDGELHVENLALVVSRDIQAGTRSGGSGERLGLEITSGASGSRL